MGGGDIFQNAIFESYFNHSNINLFLVEEVPVDTIILTKEQLELADKLAELAFRGRAIRAGILPPELAYDINLGGKGAETNISSVGGGECACKAYENK